MNCPTWNVIIFWSLYIVGGHGILKSPNSEHGGGWYNGGRQHAPAPGMIPTPVPLAPPPTTVQLNEATLDLLKALIIADVEEENEEEEKSNEKGEKVSQVSPLPVIEEESSSLESSPTEKLMQAKAEELNACAPECQEIINIPDIVLPDENILDILIEVEEDLSQNLDIDSEEESQYEEKESCYGSMPSIENEIENNLELDLENYAICDQEGTETSPSSDEMNIECHNQLYENEKIARSCQEVSNWLVHYTEKPGMKRSYSVEIAKLAQVKSAADEGLIDAYTESHDEYVRLKRGRFETSPSYGSHGVSSSQSGGPVIWYSTPDGDFIHRPIGNLIFIKPLLSYEYVTLEVWYNSYQWLKMFSKVTFKIWT